MDTIIYLDVDGVVAPLPFSEPVDLPARSGWERWERVKAWGFPITFSPDLVDWLNEVARRRDVEIVWATSWTSNAASELAPAIGLHARHWRHLPLKGSATKLDGLLALHTPHTRAVWLDDDLGDGHYEEAGLPTEVESLREHGIEHLCIAPDPSVGLTRDHARRIDMYLGGSLAFSSNSEHGTFVR